MKVEELKKKEIPLSSVAYPIEGEAGKTGNWRTIRPVIEESKCVMVKKGEMNCLRCWMYCPEACITKSIPPKVNYDYCKGCGVCAEECPSKAIHMEEEAKYLEEEK
ncbi:MAG: 4Fe-4S binding protein [Candidatus Helarchaeota archaeon]